MTYDEAKKIKARLEENVELTANTLRAIPGVGSGPMGLTPDAVRTSPDYRAACAAYDKAFAALRDFNGKFTKAFKAEYAAERRARRAAGYQS